MGISGALAPEASKNRVFGTLRGAKLPHGQWVVHTKCANVFTKHDSVYIGCNTMFNLLKLGIADPEDLEEVQMVKTVGFGVIRG